MYFLFFLIDAYTCNKETLILWKCIMIALIVMIASDKVSLTLQNWI